MNTPDHFKTCSQCGFEWPTREAFLGDPALDVIGYQANFEALKMGFFLFNHTCKSTLSVRAGEFGDFYEGPVFEARATGGEQCPGYCLNQEELSPCPAECECAFVREILLA